MNYEDSYKTRFATAWILVVAAILLIVWDLYARQFDAGTISEFLLSEARRWPVVPFLAGVLGGHCFWFQEVEADCAGHEDCPECGARKDPPHEEKP